jgi:hypothetical protein
MQKQKLVARTDVLIFSYVAHCDLVNNDSNSFIGEFFPCL